MIERRAANSSFAGVFMEWTCAVRTWFESFGRLERCLTMQMCNWWTSLKSIHGARKFGNTSDDLDGNDCYFFVALTMCVMWLD